MKETVRQAFVPLTVTFEGGYIDWLFPDVKGLISTGFGLLLDPVSMAVGLPWRHYDGRLASREEIVAEWASLKNYVEKNPGSERRSYRTFASMTSIRLGKEGLYQAFQGKMNQNERVIRVGFPEWDSWPADAQLAVMSMAWACGPAFYSPAAGHNYWPKLTAALRAKDFQTAAVECFMNEEAANPGIIPRNKANRIMFLNAAVAHDLQLSPETLLYPTDIGAEPVGKDDITQPSSTPVIRPPPLQAKSFYDFEIVHRAPSFDDDDDGNPPEAA